MPFPDPATEQQWVVAAKADPAAFGLLYDLYFDRIYTYIARRVADRSTAEDLTADTFMKALANLGRYRFTGQPFAAWLYRIAANVLADHYRRQRPVERLSCLPLAAVADAPEEAALRLDTRSHITRAVSALTPDQQEVVLLRFGADLPLKEIAGIVGKSEGAVKALLFRALQTLRDQLDRNEVRS